MKQITDKIAEIAVDWWADVLVNPKFDNGEISFATVLADSATKEISEKQLIKFKDLLKQYIVDEVEKLPTDDASIIMGCDYGPDSNLRHFANECLISENNFPWKTTMTIGRDFCYVKYGYNELPTYLYVTEARLQRRLEDALKTVEYYKQQDNAYFNEWSSFTKEEIIKIATDSADKCRLDLEGFKNGTKQTTDIIVS